MSKRCLKQLESTQSSTIKRILGFSQRSHHSNVFRAVNICSIKTLIDKAVLSLWYRVFQVKTPTRVLCASLLSQYILGSPPVSGTLIDRVVKLNVSPVKGMLSKLSPEDLPLEEGNQDGVVESLRFLILQENFLKPYSSEHIIASLLTKAF